MPPTKTERYAWPASVPPRLQKRNLFDVLANGTVSFLYLVLPHLVGLHLLQPRPRVEVLTFRKALVCRWCVRTHGGTPSFFSPWGNQLTMQRR